MSETRKSIWVRFAGDHIRMWASKPFEEGEEYVHAAALASKDAEIERLKRAVVTFAGPHALRWACEFGLPDGHLHPKHYDLLAECGARLDDFVRAELPNQAAGATPQPRSEVSGPETPGNHSADPE